MTIDLDAIRKRAKDCLAGYAGPTIANNVFAIDVPALLAHIDAQNAAHEAEMLEVAAFAYFRPTVAGGASSDRTYAETILAAYLAQKEKKDA